MRRYLSFLILCLFMQTARAQFSEAGVLLGGSYYVGDLNPNIHFLQTHFAGGIVYRYNFNPRLSFKGSILSGTVEGNDQVSHFNEKRNLSFKSNVTDFSAQFEFNFFNYSTGNERYPFSPYVFVGIAAFKFNPKAEYNGKWYYLQPLGTEGQGTSEYPDRKPYSLFSYSIPFGLGLKYSVAKILCVGAEYGIRRSFTDYLDDVSKTYADPMVLGYENTPTATALGDRSSDPNANIDRQRGNSKTKDWYAFFGIFVTFKLDVIHEKCPAYDSD